MARLRLCTTRKFSYLDEATALADLADWRQLPAEYHHHGHPPIRAYRCPDCGFWHLTATPWRRAYGRAARPATLPR